MNNLYKYDKIISFLNNLKKTQYGGANQVSTNCYKMVPELLALLDKYHMDGYIDKTSESINKEDLENTVDALIRTLERKKENKKIREEMRVEEMRVEEIRVEEMRVEEENRVEEEKRVEENKQLLIQENNRKEQENNKLAQQLIFQNNQNKGSKSQKKDSIKKVQNNIKHNSYATGIKKIEERAKKQKIKDMNDLHANVELENIITQINTYNSKEILSMRESSRIKDFKDVIQDQPLEQLLKIKKEKDDLLAHLLKTQKAHKSELLACYIMLNIILDDIKVLESMHNELEDVFN